MSDIAEKLAAAGGGTVIDGQAVFDGILSDETLAAIYERAFGRAPQMRPSSARITIGGGQVKLVPSGTWTLLL